MAYSRLRKMSSCSIGKFKVKVVTEIAAHQSQMVGATMLIDNQERIDVTLCWSRPTDTYPTSLTHCTRASVEYGAVRWIPHSASESSIIICEDNVQKWKTPTYLFKSVRNACSNLFQVMKTSSMYLRDCRHLLEYDLEISKSCSL